MTLPFSRYIRSVMTTRSDKVAVNKAKRDMLNRARKELSAHNNDAIAEQFIVAENNIDRFLHAIDSRTINFPNSQQLAWSCLTILVVTGELTRYDAELLARLYAPSVSVSMFHIASKIREIKERATRKVEIWSKKAEH